MTNIFRDFDIDEIYVVIRPDKKKKAKLFSDFVDATRHKHKVAGRIMFRYNSQSDTWILERDR